VLRELSVRNLALIEDARVELGPGFNAWTGETGAGKSLLLTALNLVLGGKASADLVREGKAEAIAVAVFEVEGNDLKAEVETILGGPLEDDTLILTRRVSAQGRSAASVCGLPVNASTLRRLAEHLIDVHNQDDGRDLLDPNHQRDLLDAHGGLEDLVGKYKARREAHAKLRERRLELLAAADRRARELALLTFERDELQAAAPRAGEYRELAATAHRLAHAKQFREAVGDGYRLLYEADHSAQGLLERVARTLASHAESSAEVAEAARTLDRLADETREVAYTLRALGREREDPAMLEEVEARLALYRKLSARFRLDPDALSDRLEAVEAELARLGRDEADLLALDVPLAESWKQLKDAAGALTDARRRAGKAFAKAVQGRFAGLCLNGARLSVTVEPISLGDDPTATPPPEGGADRVEFVFAPNPGEPPTPLRRTASGGERSRVTLAIKAVLADVDRVPTLVFDEIDTGVGGRLGNHLGRVLADIGRRRQVLCITHLPQMASYAEHQWVVRKEGQRGRTRTVIERLDDDQRVEELATMLRGDAAAERTKQEARAMLVEARAGTA
jgi:DNA repair protein RecN (Recombination protein N)